MQIRKRLVPPVALGARGLASLAAVAMAALGADHARAASPPTASGTISTTGTGASYTYALTLNDAANSPSPIGSVWAAWLPGEFFLGSVPTSASAPTGWTSNIAGDSIQWTANSPAFDVPAGGSLSGFGFQTADSPSIVDGNSPAYPGTPTTTSVAYHAGLFSDSGTTFVFTPAAVPEPVSLALLMPAALLLRRRSV